MERVHFCCSFFFSDFVSEYTEHSNSTCCVWINWKIQFEFSLCDTTTRSMRCKLCKSSDKSIKRLNHFKRGPLKINHRPPPYGATSQWSTRFYRRQLHFTTFTILQQNPQWKMKRVAIDSVCVWCATEWQRSPCFNAAEKRPQNFCYLNKKKCLNSM